jgi:hypothetical protein
MTTVAEICSDAIAFSYRSIDRLVLNAYIPTLQCPAAMAVFFREVWRKPILSGAVFKALTDRFVAQIREFADRRGLVIVRVTGRRRPGEVAQALLKKAARANRWGVVAILVHQESARVFASTHGGGRATNFWVKEDRRLINHYYFYFRDGRYGDGFVRISSYPPFQTRVWMNAHGYIAAELRRRRLRCRLDQNCVVDVSNSAVLQEVADQFNAALAEQIARHWLSMVPQPLTAEEQAQGFGCRLSVYQAEFSDNVIFHKTQVLNRMYEQLLRDHLHVGRLDMVKLIFGRRVYPSSPCHRFNTRILRQGVVSCLKVFYKGSFLKQYNKGGRVLRTEVCVNDPRHFGVRKGLVHLDYLGTICGHAIGRFLKAQAVALSTALDRSTFERMMTPSMNRGKRVPALRLGAPGLMRVLEALGCAGLAWQAFSNADLRSILTDRLGVPPDQAKPTQVGYQLRKLRGKGLVRKAKGRNRYTLTDLGYRVVVYLVKLYERLLVPVLDTLDRGVHALGESTHYLDRGLKKLNQQFDELACVCGFKTQAAKS